MLVVDARIHICTGNMATNADHRQVTDFPASDVLEEFDAGGVNVALSRARGRDRCSTWLAARAAKQHRDRAAKATGGPSDSAEAYPYRDIHRHVRKLYDAYGPERRFWGTDITRMPCSWKQCVTMFTEELPWLSAKDKELIMGRAVCNWIGWNLPG